MLQNSKDHKWHIVNRKDDLARAITLFSDRNLLRLSMKGYTIKEKVIRK